MECVGAALENHVDRTAQGTAELRLTTRSDDLKFTHDIEPVEDAAEPCGVVVGGQAIDDEAIGKISLA